MAAREKGKFFVPLAVAALLALHAALALWAVSGKSTTADEIIHLTGGYAYWHLDDYRLHPENGILPQRWAALPAALTHPPFPKLEGNPYWKTSEVQAVGHQFFYETGHDHFPMLMAGRAMIVLFNLATGALIFCWSRRLFGTAGAFVSLGLFALCPNFLAHGALATSDACMTFFFLASVSAWWRHLHDGRARWWWLSAVVFGLAWVAKYSAPLLLPMMVLMALARAWTAEPLVLLGRTFTTRRGKFGAAALSAVGHGLVAMAVIWACYGFRYAAFNPALPPADHFIRPWEVIDLHIGFPGQVLRAFAAVHALPEAFLYGFAYVLETAQVRSAFLNGDYSTTGWPSFFPWTFALKTTLPVLAATGLVLALTLRRWRDARTPLRHDLYRVAPLAALFAVYWIFSLTSHLNIGHRHILPTYPVLFIAAGALGSWLVSRRAVLVAAVVALLGGQVVEATRIAPHYLAYFNALGGGPANGHRHLVDSSLDWGQDLPTLRTWLAEHRRPGEKFYLGYFGSAWPPHYGMRPDHFLPAVSYIVRPPHTPYELEPGLYCVSATLLAEVYSTDRGPWTDAHEEKWRRFRATPPTAATFKEFDLLRFTRLLKYLQLRAPDAHAGYSILIYRLTPADLRAALEAPVTGAYRLRAIRP